MLIRFEILYTFDLLKTYQPTDVFLEEWEENEEYRGECDRVIRTLS